jgi:integrase/recombinase XerD
MRPKSVGLRQRRGVILHQQNLPEAAETPAISGQYPAQADSDETLIRLWLDGRSSNTRRAYESDVRSMIAATGKPLRATTLAELQGWVSTLAELAPASRARKIGAAKSLLSFGRRVGYLPFNVGAALRLPPIKNVLAERILEESDVIRLIALEPDQRNHALLRLGYIAGLRISELCGLRWRDTRRRVAGGQIAVFGKAARPGSSCSRPRCGASWASCAGMLRATIPCFGRGRVANSTLPRCTGS